MSLSILMDIDGTGQDSNDQKETINITMSPYDLQHQSQSFYMQPQSQSFLHATS